MQKQTTGATISRLGVLTCLTLNFIEENHLEADERTERMVEMTEILEGQVGVPHSKVMLRSIERCQNARWN